MLVSAFFGSRVGVIYAVNSFSNICNLFVTDYNYMLPFVEVPLRLPRWILPGSSTKSATGLPTASKCFFRPSACRSGDAAWRHHKIHKKLFLHCLQLEAEGLAESFAGADRIPSR
jgi:hypothetical protein